MLRSVARIKSALLSVATQRRPFSAQCDWSQFKKLAQSYPSVGMLKYNGHHLGSCVLVGKNAVLTTAHCVANLPDKKNIHLEVFFSPGIGVKIMGVFHHPLYDPVIRRTSAISKDIAVLSLENNVTDILPAPLDYQNLAGENECVSVGFPGSFALSPERKPVYAHQQKMGLKVSCYSESSYEVYIPNILESKVAHVIDDASDELVKSNDPLYGAASYPGMSGGGLFIDGYLAAINQSSASFKQNTPLTHSFFVPLSLHESWLTQVMKGNLLKPAELDFQRVDKLKKLLQEKIHLNILSVNYSEFKKCITVHFPPENRMNAAELLTEMGFSVAHSVMDFRFLSSPIIVLLNETPESAQLKLLALPNVLLKMGL